MVSSAVGCLALASLLFASTLASLEPYPAALSSRGYDYQAPRQSSVAGVANEYLPPHQFRSGPAFSDSSVRSASNTYLPPAEPSSRYLPANPSGSQAEINQPEVVDARSSFLASSGLPGSRQMSSWYPEEQRQRSASLGAPADTYGAPGVRSLTKSSGVSASYGTPARSYGAPQSTYGAPARSYGAPSATYGTPARSYGTPAATYGVPDNFATRLAGAGSGGYARQRQHDDDGWNNEPAKYSFRYHVNDPPSNNDFGHEESRDGSLVRGTYFVLLPDGRRQVVKYEADEHGYRPTISYETAEDLQRANYLRSGSQSGEGPY